MILVLTHSSDLAADLVIRHLVNSQTQFLRIDTDTIGTPQRHFGFADTPTLIYDGRTIFAESITAVWARRFARSLSLHKVDAKYASFVAREFRDVIEAFLEQTPGITINSFEADRRAGNRLRQATLAKAAGFNIPATLVTQDKGEAERFRSNGPTIAKAISYGAIESGGDLVAHTTDLANVELQDLDVCPVLLQSKIAKRREWRVTTVGKKIFSARTRADVYIDPTDWRRTKDVERIFEHGTLPAIIGSRLLDLCNASDILFGAHDLIETPEGDFFFLETNPAGQWGWLELSLGLPIGQAVADLLCNPHG